MSQFDLFAGPVESAPPSAFRQPPVFITAGQSVDERPAGLMPLRVINADWLEVKVTDAEFQAERLKHYATTSDEYVMLLILVARGVRARVCAHPDLVYLYDYVEAPFVIRKRTEPGMAITCRQGPIDQRI